MSYPSAVTGNSYSFAATKLINNKLYSESHVDNESHNNNEEYGCTDDMHKSKEKLRSQKFNKWNNALQKDQKATFRVFPDSVLDNVPSLKKYSLLRLVLEQFHLKVSWLNVLLERELQ